MTSSLGFSVSVRATIGALALDIAFEMGAETLVIVGPNGAGKSSLLALILGVRPVQEGHIVIAGRPMVDTANGLDVTIEQRRIGYVPQSFALFPHLSVRENVAFAVGSAEPHLSRLERNSRVSAILRDLDLSAFAERKPSTLSGGERQRVALARALSVNPRALLLDEPLSALDVSRRDAVRDLLAYHLRTVGLPTLVVTHEPSDARRLGQRILVLESGRVTQIGDWDELKKRPATRFVQWFTASS